MTIGFINRTPPPPFKYDPKQSNSDSMWSGNFCGAMNGHIFSGISHLNAWSKRTITNYKTGEFFGDACLFCCCCNAFLSCSCCNDHVRYINIILVATNDTLSSSSLSRSRSLFLSGLTAIGNAIIFHYAGEAIVSVFVLVHSREKMKHCFSFTLYAYTVAIRIQFIQHGCMCECLCSHSTL